MILFKLVLVLSKYSSFFNPKLSAILVTGISQLSCSRDTVPNTVDLKRFSLAHGDGGFSPWSAGSKVETSWWKGMVE